MTRLLNKLFNVRRHEWPQLGALYVMNFVVLIGIYWGDEIVEAAFLNQIGVRFLPLVMMGNALCAVLAIVLYTAFADRVDNGSLLILILGVGALGIVVGLIFLQRNWVTAAYPLLYLVIQVPLRTILNIHWATYVNGFYDTRAAKRIVPVLGSAVRLAGMVSGLTMPLLNRLLSPAQIIIVWLVAIVATALLAWLTPRLLHKATPPPAPPLSSRRWIDNIREGYHYVARSRFLRWMAVATLLMMVLMQLVDYRTKDILSHLNSVQEISNFTGALRGWSNLVALPFQLLFLGRIIARIGLGSTALIFPLGTLATCIGLIAAPQIATAALGQLDRTTLRTTLRNPTDSLLYNAVPLHVKGRARAFIGGLVIPIGSFLGGLSLMLLESHDRFPAWVLSSLIGLLAVAYLVGAWVVRRQYAGALLQMLEQEDYSFLLPSASTNLTVVDPATLRSLQARLEQPDAAPEFVIFMAQLIVQVGGDQAVPILDRFVRRAADPDVRASIGDVLAVSDIRSDALYRLYVALLDDPDGRVRRSAFAGLERLARPGDVQFQTLAMGLLDDPDIDLRVQVLSMLVQTNDFYSLAPAVQALDELLHHQSPRRRAQGVYVLGHLCDTVRAFAQLTGYFSDPADQVRLQAALAAESQTLSATLIAPDQMRDWLNDPVERIRQVAVTILGRMDANNQARDLLVTALTDSSPLIRAAAADALVEIGADIIPLLQQRTTDGAPNARLEKMAAFVLCRINPREHGALLWEQVDRCLSAIYGNLGQLVALSSLERWSSVLVLQSALVEQNRRLTDDIFYLLGAIYAPAHVDLVAESLRNADPRVRANAVEALEALTSPQMTRLIAPLFEPERSRSQLLALGQEVWEIDTPDAKRDLEQLVTRADGRWLRAIAVLALGEIGAQLQPRSGDAARPAPKRRRRVPTDLLGMLAGSSSTPASGRKTNRRAAPANVFTLAEIERLLDLARSDRDAQVRSAAQAAGQMMAETHILERAKKEGFVLSTIERIVFLKKVPFFQGMTIEQLDVLANVCEEILCEEDTRIFEQGDPGGALYVVVNGRIAIERAGRRRGSTVRLATIEANAYFGEMSLFDRGPRSAAAVAVQDTLMLRLRREPLLALLRRYPDLSLELINVLSQRLRDADDRIAKLTRSKPQQLQKLYDKLTPDLN